MTDFKIENEISARKVAGLLCSGFEGGVNYWLRIMDYRQPVVTRPVLDDETCPYTDYPLLEGGAVICRLTDERGQTDAKYKPLVLDREAVERGLRLMAQKHPRHWGDFLNEDSDASTGDVLIQLSLLGEVRYG